MIAYQCIVWVILVLYLCYFNLMILIIETAPHIYTLYYCSSDVYISWMIRVRTTLAITFIPIIHFCAEIH